MYCLTWLTFLLEFLAVAIAVLIFWIYFFWSLYLFCNDFPSIGKFWPCCCLSFNWLFIEFKMECLASLHSLWLFSYWLRQSSWSFEKCSMGTASAVLLLLLVNFVNGFRLELMLISLIVSIKSSLTHLHDFLLLVLLT